MSALFEHSPWVEARADARPSSGDRHADLMAVVHDATPEEQLALIRAHPELAGKAAVDGSLTEASAAEQASAGLDRLTQAEFDRFHALNAAYREKFGFPFIICVRLTDKAGILAAMERRLANDRDTEIAAALERDRRDRPAATGGHAHDHALHPCARHHARPARGRPGGGAERTGRRDRAGHDQRRRPLPRSGAGRARAGALRDPLFRGGLFPRRSASRCPIRPSSTR